MENFDAVIEFESLDSADKKLVGQYQEILLAQDFSGGDDGMWFDAAVYKVVTDREAVIAAVTF